MVILTGHASFGKGRGQTILKLSMVGINISSILSTLFWTQIETGNNYKHKLSFTKISLLQKQLKKKKHTFITETSGEQGWNVIQCYNRWIKQKNDKSCLWYFITELSDE